MIRPLAGAIFIVTIPMGAAHSADVWYGGGAVVPAPVSAAHDWSGFYAGINGGHANGAFDFGPITLFTPDTLPDGMTFDVFGSPGGSGWMGGVQGGFNFQQGAFVLGLEGDYQVGPIDADQVVLPTFPTGSDTTTVNMRLSSLATLRGRVGLASDRVLVYATGGLAMGDVETTVRVIDTVGYDESSTAKNAHTGYSVGGGVEYAIDKNWSLKGEYLYSALKAETYRFVFPTPSSGDFEAAGPIKLDTHLIRVGLNYKF